MEEKFEEGYKASMETSGSCNETGYAVEARYEDTKPKQIGTQIFDNRWRTVKVDKGTSGVPDAHAIFSKKYEHGLMDYNAAQAMRYWLHAIADKDGGSVGFCLQTRLVVYDVTHSYTVKASRPIDLITSIDQVYHKYNVKLTEKDVK